MHAPRHLITMFLTMAFAFLLLACIPSIETGHLACLTGEAGLACELFVPSGCDGDTSWTET